MSKTKTKCPHCKGSKVVTQEMGEEHSAIVQCQCLECGKAWTNSVKKSAPPVAEAALELDPDDE